MSNVILPLIADLEVAESQQQFDLSVFELQFAYDMDSTVNIVAGQVADFDGPYSYIPTEEEQIVPIMGKRATNNIVVAPIPTNYGRITWNGSVITVS